MQNQVARAVSAFEDCIELIYITIPENDIMTEAAKKYCAKPFLEFHEFVQRL
jgi:hypothetical protein